MFAAPPTPVQIVTVDRPTQVSAYGSGVLFSKRDPATGRFKLWYTETGRPPAPLPVADRAVPFDADLGPGDHGHFLAVYSRCAAEPKWDPAAEDAPPDYSTGRGCNLYELDLSTGVERRLPGTGVTPAVWKDGLAFARVYASQRVVLYSRRGGATRRLAPLARGARPVGLDLYGRRLASAWSHPSTHVEGPASEVILDDVVSGRRRLVERFPGGGLTTVALAAPAFEGGTLYYAELCQGDPSGCPHRTGLVGFRYSTSEKSRAQIGREDLWQARGGGFTYVLHGDPGSSACYLTATNESETCSIEATTPDYENGLSSSRLRSPRL